MRIRLLAFASAAEALGTPETELELPDASRMAELRAHLERRHPDLGSLWDRLAIAVDGQIVGDNHPLSEGCEVALLPPVSGGVAQADDELPSGGHLVRGPIDVEALIHQARRPGFGAIVSFLGTVRDEYRGRPVRRLYILSLLFL